MKEFNLSEKENLYNSFRVEDVKEFIRLLKENIPDVCFKEKRDDKISLVNVSYFIDKLAGEKLI